MQYYDRFEWPVPSAFSEALAKCRFEEGDLLYSDKCAYELPWGEAKANLRHSIQVVYPLKSFVEYDNVDMNSEFLSNWNLGVTFDLTDYAACSKSRKKSFQGNLYLALVHGDLSFIDLPYVMAPPLVVSEIDSRLAYISLSKTRQSQFLLAYDSTNPTLRSKKEKIRSVLKDKAVVETHAISSLPEFSQLKTLPTMEIVVFNIDLPLEATDEEIKKAVYVPVKNKKTDKTRWRIRDHGLLR